MQTLDAFEVQIGLPNNIISNTDEYKKYLNMDISQLENLSSRDCANISYKLGQFSLYIQRTLNREKALSRTLKNKINKIIAPKISQFSGPWDLQRMSAIADNDVSESLNEQLIESEVKQDSLENISLGLKELANLMKSIQFSKRDNG